VDSCTKTKHCQRTIKAIISTYQSVPLSPQSIAKDIEERGCKDEIAVGKAINFFSKIGVAAKRVPSGELKAGDVLRIMGHVTDFEQTVESFTGGERKLEKVEQAKTLTSRLKRQLKRIHSLHCEAVDFSTLATKLFD
jgi:hypothetical protein